MGTRPCSRRGTSEAGRENTRLRPPAHEVGLTVMVNQAISSGGLYFDKETGPEGGHRYSVCITEIGDSDTPRVTLLQHGDLAFETQGYSVLEPRALEALKQIRPSRVLDWSDSNVVDVSLLGTESLLRVEAVRAPPSERVSTTASTNLFNLISIIFCHEASSAKSKRPHCNTLAPPLSSAIPIRCSCLSGGICVRLPARSLQKITKPPDRSKIYIGGFVMIKGLQVKRYLVQSQTSAVRTKTPCQEMFSFPQQGRPGISFRQTP